jgi:hypothetical protein
MADFIDGRVLTRIDAKQYMALARQADQEYERYADYVTHLRRNRLDRSQPRTLFFLLGSDLSLSSNKLVSSNHTKYLLMFQTEKES